MMTHRRLAIPQQAPVGLCEPLVLLDLARAAAAAQPVRLALVEEPVDGILAGPA